MPMMLLLEGEPVAELTDFGWKSDDESILRLLNFIACPRSIPNWTSDAIPFLTEKAARKLGPGWTVA
jgi:hypothetical protein